MDRILYLVLQYQSDDLTDAESQELTDWISASEANRVEFNRLIDPVGTRRELEFRKRMELHMKDTQVPQVVTLWARWGKWVAAAGVLLFIAGYILNKNVPNKQEIAKVAPTPKLTNDVAPGKFGARLTLSDGKHIVLDSIQSGQLAEQGGTSIYNDKGKLSYSPANSSTETVFNTLETAPGETYSLELSDGTKVWLNSNSLLKFPAAFNGAERNVEMKGEVFFEVEKNAKKPFRVAIHTVSGVNPAIEVLGTQFNVNAYEDEPLIQTTLLEGSVVIQPGHELGQKKMDAVKLKPGQQGNIRDGKDQSVRINTNVNTEAVTAWKDQTFYFSSDDLKTIMRQLARWYNVEVIYEKGVPELTMSGMVSRKNNLSEVLKVLELNDIHFRIEGKKLIVMK
jgi:transmembrane sensor